jgi:hypothetical protein
METLSLGLPFMVAFLRPTFERWNKAMRQPARASSMMMPAIVVPRLRAWSFGLPSARQHLPHLRTAPFSATNLRDPRPATIKIGLPAAQSTSTVRNPR